MRHYLPRWLIWSLSMLGIAMVIAAMCPGVELLLGLPLSYKVPGAHVTELSVIEESFGILSGAIWVLGLPVTIIADIRKPRGGRP